jgi:hypothetical protein
LAANIGSGKNAISIPQTIKHEPKIFPWVEVGIRSPKKL